MHKRSKGNLTQRNSYQYHPLVRLTFALLQKKDVENRLFRLKNNTSAGPDGITYEIWKVFPCLTDWLFGAFKLCQNWRPISLQNTIARIYSGILESLLRHCITENQLISPNQKGFMNSPGTLEHDYYIHAKVRLARRNGLPIYFCSYDFKDAYGSLNHSYVRHALKFLGLSADAINLILSPITETQFLLE